MDRNNGKVKVTDTDDGKTKYRHRKIKPFNTKLFSSNNLSAEHGNQAQHNTKVYRIVYTGAWVQSNFFS